MRVTSRPTSVEATSSPATIGIVRSPDSVGVRPRAICMYWERKTVVPNSAMPTATLAIDREDDGAVAEQPQRHERLLHPALDLDGREHEQCAEADEHRRLPRDPGVLLPGQRDPDQQARHAAGDQRGTGVVDRHGPAAARQVERALEDDEGGDGERNADVEAPAPAEASR